MSRAPSPHMVLALQAGLVSQELLGALTAVDDDLCSACLFAELLGHAFGSGCMAATTPFVSVPQSRGFRTSVVL